MFSTLDLGKGETGGRGCTHRRREDVRPAEDMGLGAHSVAAEKGLPTNRERKAWRDGLNVRLKQNQTRQAEKTCAALY